MATHQEHHREIIVTSELNPINFFRSLDCGSYVPYHYHDAFEFIYLVNGSMNLSNLHYQSPLSVFIAHLPPLPTTIPTQINLSLEPIAQESCLTPTADQSTTSNQNTPSPEESITPQSTTAPTTPPRHMQLSSTCLAAITAQKSMNIDSHTSEQLTTPSPPLTPPTVTAPSKTDHHLQQSYDKNPHALQVLENIAAGQAMPLQQRTKTPVNQTSPSRHKENAAEEATTSTPTANNLGNATATSPDPLTVPNGESNHGNNALDYATGLAVNPSWQKRPRNKDYTNDQGVTYQLQTSEYNFALINSNEMHASSCPSWNDAFVLQIPESFIKKLLNYPEDFPLYFNPHLASADCLQRFSLAFLRLAVIHENYQQKPSFQIHFNHALYAILECLLEMMVTDATLSQLQALNYPIMSNVNLKRLQPVFDFLNRHYHEPLKLEQIAAVAHLHPSYFCQFFKDAVGMSPLSYLSELRLCHIYYDLTTQKQPIAELLQRHGYSNSKKFYCHFKERFHQNPSEVRQQQQHFTHTHHADAKDDYSYFERLYYPNTHQS